MAYERSENEVRLQRKLVPLNIVVCVLCLVSAISLLFAPLITINLSEVKDAFMEMMESEDGDYGSDAPDSDGIDIDFAVMFDVLFDDELSFSAIDLAKFANSDESAIIPFVVSKMDKIMDIMIIPIMSQTILDAFEEAGFDTEGVDYTALNEKFEAFNNVDSEEDMRAAAGDMIDEIARLVGGSIDSEGRTEVIETFVDLYYDTIEVTGGDFDIEKLLCVLASKGMELEEPVTSYKEFVEEFFAGGGDEETSEVFESLAMVDEALKVLAQGIFGMVMFSAIMWLVLFLFSLLHIFARNKRFVMWYVKLFGGIPWFIFGLIPMVAGGAFASMGEEMAIVGSIFGAITSATWISGVCLGLLWLVSIFWAFPIKHKIRKDRKG
ncbi:MAG: hypothetical protein J1G05_03705 [Clostridiales bacterium]|nr:hypothetical protein [Clostridiales bacterium]